MLSAEEDALSCIRSEAGAPNEKQVIEDTVKAFRWAHWLARGVSAALAFLAYALIEHPTAPGFAFIVYLLARMPSKLSGGAAVHWTMLLASVRSSELAIRRIQMQLARGGHEDEDEEDLKVHRVPAAASSRPRDP